MAVDGERGQRAETRADVDNELSTTQRVAKFALT